MMMMMDDHGVTLCILYEDIAKKLKDKDKRAKLSEGGKEEMTKRIEKSLEIRTSVYYGAINRTIVALLTAMTIFGIANYLEGTKLLFTYRNPIHLIIYILLMALIIVISVKKRKLEKQLVKIKESATPVTIVDGALVRKEDKKKKKYKIDSISDMVETKYGFFLLFNGKEDALFELYQKDAILDLSDELKQLIDEDKYLMITTKR